MSKCNNCNVIIMDKTDVCPLCHQVLSGDKSGTYNMYPDVKDTSRKYRMAENLILFLSVVITLVSLTVDYMIDGEMGWSLIVLLGMFYANATMRLAIAGKSGYRFKMISMVVSAIAVLWGIDYLTGNRGWALSIVFPSAIVLVDIGILILMVVNSRNWQSYMMLQIFTILLSIIPLVLIGAGIIKWKYMALIAMGISLFIFLGTLIIGDKRARNELKRRFHV